MDTDLFNTLYCIWILITFLIEISFYFLCFNAGSPVTAKEVVRLFFTKKHLFLYGCRYVFLVISCAVTGGFSLLDSIIYETREYDTLLCGLTCCILIDATAIGLAMATWLRTP